VDAEHLVLHGAVVQLERARAEEDAAPPALLPERLPSAEIGDEEQSADRGQPAERMEEPVGHEAEVRRAEVVEVVPVEELVEHRLVDEGDEPDAEEDTGPEVPFREPRPLGQRVGRTALDVGPVIGSVVSPARVHATSQAKVPDVAADVDKPRTG
jgi:hypothetical protein